VVFVLFGSAVFELLSNLVMLSRINGRCITAVERPVLSGIMRVNIFIQISVRLRYWRMQTKNLLNLLRGHI
jgi:hypothetical protein